MIKDEEQIRQKTKTKHVEAMRFKGHKAYTLFIICVHLTSFTILMYEYSQWFLLHKQQLHDLKKYFIWNGYAQFVVLLTFHPAFKLLDIAIWIARRRASDEKWSKKRAWTLFVYNTTMVGVEVAVICCYLLAGLVILVYCGLMFTIWIWFGLGSLCLFAWWLLRCLDAHPLWYLNDEEKQRKWTTQMLIFAHCNLFYIFINVCSWVTVSYFITDRYLVSLGYVFTSQYCPSEILVDWTDWKMVFLFLHWCLF